MTVLGTNSGLKVKNVLIRKVIFMAITAHMILVLMGDLSFLPFDCLVWLIQLFSNYVVFFFLNFYFISLLLATFVWIYRRIKMALVCMHLFVFDFCLNVHVAAHLVSLYVKRLDCTVIMLVTSM